MLTCSAQAIFQVFLTEVASATNGKWTVAGATSRGDPTIVLVGVHVSGGLFEQCGGNGRS